MEGPSLVIAQEEMAKYIGRNIKKSSGNSKFKDELSVDDFVGKKIINILSWGKHLILMFDSFSIRIHFLMFGSYRIDDPKKDREPRLELWLSPKGRLDFYTCSIQLLHDDPKNIYDWSSDLMSPKWDSKKAFVKIKALPKRTMICDILMNQAIFSGLGNIMKNEVLYTVRLQPETPIGKISDTLLRKTIKEARLYAFEFYKWKKIFQLKKHWKIVRKKICPKGHKVTRRVTGTGHRLSHFCEICQKQL